MRALILSFFMAAMLVAPSATVAARSSATEVVRIKDLGKLKGWRENSLIGYGIVAGLAGTGIRRPTRRRGRPWPMSIPSST